MIGKIIGAVVGGAVNRRPGDGGVRGAAVGTVAAMILRRMGPLGMVLGAGYAAKQALDRRRAGKETPPA